MQGVVHMYTHQANVLVYRLYPPIGIRHEELRVHQLLHSKYYSVFDAKTDGSSANSVRVNISIHVECTMLAHPEFSTALFAYSTYMFALVRSVAATTHLRSHLEYTAIGRVGTS